MENLNLIESPEVTIETILSVFKNTTEKKKLKDIKLEVCKLFQPDSLLASTEIEDKVEMLLKEDKKLGDESFFEFKDGKYNKRKNKSALPDVPLQANDYNGRAGECAVMSELLYAYYNVNRMMIDEGIDLVAVKDNIYYYIQVKTVGIREGKIFAQINIDNFDKFIGNQMRYFIVARYKDKKGEVRNMFFLFTQQEITKGIFDRYIKRGEKTVSIKIKFHERTGDPILYDEKEASAKWNMNRFEL